MEGRLDDQDGEVLGLWGLALVGSDEVQVLVVLLNLLEDFGSRTRNQTQFHIDQKVINQLDKLPQLLIMLSDRRLLRIGHVLVRLIAHQQWRWLVLIIALVSFRLDSILLLEVLQ